VKTAFAGVARLKIDRAVATSILALVGSPVELVSTTGLIFSKQF
jgi:hypothetical protein